MKFLKVGVALLSLLAFSPSHAGENWKPYLELGLSMQLKKSTDYWIQSNRSWQCEDPGVQVAAGLEHRNGFRLFIHHESFLLCGTFNHKPEIYSNSIRFAWKFGGH